MSPGSPRGMPRLWWRASRPCQSQATTTEFGSRVASPGMVALQAPVELGRGLVSTASLQEPPVSFVVAALWAIDLRHGEGRELALLLADHLYRRELRQLLLRGLGNRPTGLVRITAVVAKKGYG